MQQKLNKNHTAADSNTYKSDQLMEMLNTIMDLKNILKSKAMKLDGDVDGEVFSDIIETCVPTKANKKLLKPKIIEYLVKAWSATRFLVGGEVHQIQLSPREQRTYATFSVTMRNIEMVCSKKYRSRSVLGRYLI